MPYNLIDCILAPLAPMLPQHCFPNTGRKRFRSSLPQKNVTHVTQILKFHMKKKDCDCQSFVEIPRLYILNYE